MDTEGTKNHREHREKIKIKSPVDSVLLCDLCVPIIFILNFLPKKQRLDL